MKDSEREGGREEEKEGGREEVILTSSIPCAWDIKTTYRRSHSVNNIKKVLTMGKFC